jgi:hypothetical protein
MASLRPENFQMSLTVALDFGGTSTKFLVETAAGRDTHQGSWSGDDHRRLWRNPATFLEQLRGLLSRFPGGPSRIDLLALSMSGNVDHPNQTYVRGWHMDQGIAQPDKCWNGVRIADHTRGVPTFVANDGVAAACGAMEFEGARFPILVVTLGSFLSASVIDDRSGGGLVVYEYDFKAKIGRTGDDVSNDALNGRDVSSRSRRIGRAIAEILPLYWSIWSWQPTSVVLLGGNSVGLDREVLEPLIRFGQHTPPAIYFGSTYEGQSEKHLRGALRFASLFNRGGIDIVKI